jgi:hypothetical protein
MVIQMGKNDAFSREQEDEKVEQQEQEVELTAEEIELLRQREEEDMIYIVEEMSLEELRLINTDTLNALRQSLVFPSNFQVFLFAKNIKVFGGINGYINDFLPKLDGMIAAPNGAIGALALLIKMRNYEGISAENMERVDAALQRLSQVLDAQSGKKQRKHSVKKAKHSKKGKRIVKKVICWLREGKRSVKKSKRSKKW